MPIYKCKVLDEYGKKKVILKDGNDEVSLKAQLKLEKYVLLDAKVLEEEKPNTFFAISSRVKPEEVVSFLRQFAVMINASVPIADALGLLKGQQFSKVFQKILIEVHMDVLSGSLLSEAFDKHPKVFPRFFVDMVAIGEVSGSLEQVLSSMADYYEHDRKIKKKTKSAMVYPLLLLAMIIIVVIFMSIVILPQFDQMFKEFGGTIPTFTKVVLSISNFIKDNIFFILFGAISLTLILVLFFKSKRGAKVWGSIKAHTPLIRQIITFKMSARFAKAFSMLLKSGMNITDCLDNLVRVIDNKSHQDKFIFAVNEVKRGKRLAKSLENTKIFPMMLTEMINVGERTGSLEEVLDPTTNFFDEQMEAAISRATTMLEPMMILLLGGVVVMVLLSVYLPMIDLMNQI